MLSDAAREQWEQILEDAKAYQELLILYVPIDLPTDVIDWIDERKVGIAQDITEIKAKLSD